MAVGSACAAAGDAGDRASLDNASRSNHNKLTRRAKAIRIESDFSGALYLNRESRENSARYPVNAGLFI